MTPLMPMVPLSPLGFSAGQIAPSTGNNRVIIYSLTETQAGYCSWEHGSTCKAISTYKIAATRVDTYLWEVTGATIELGQGTDEITVTTVSDTNNTFNVECTVSNQIDSDSINNDYTHLRTEIIPTDTIKPVITLIGGEEEVSFGDIYTDKGATAVDNIDGDITADILVEGLPINTSVAGTYPITYNVTDASGNVADTVVRTVIVQEEVTVVLGQSVTYDDTNISAEFIVTFEAIIYNSTNIQQEFIA